MDQALTGPFYLKQPEIAGMILNAIRHGEHGMHLYEIHAYVIMANHVHLLITPLVEIAKITQTLKRHTAKEANQILGLNGADLLAR